jgi:RNA polymerase sigma factor (sigma-70 family)
LLATQSDERLVDLVRAGSEPAFDAVVTRYRGQLVRYCAAIVGRERAEDVVQQAFVSAFGAMQRDENELNLKPWLYRIAHNASLNALRDRALRDEQLDLERTDLPHLDGAAGVEQPDQALERRDEIAAVLAAVDSLPPRQRDAMVLRELEGRSYEEIARALGVGGGSVRALLHRARNSVRMAATAVTPVGLLLRIPAAGHEAGEGVAARVAELTAGVGAGAATTKVAATVLATGAVAGGVALGPGQGDSRPARGQDSPTAPRPGQRGVPPAGIEQGVGDDSDRDGSGREDEDAREDRSGPSERSGPGDGDDLSDRSGPGDGGLLRPDLDNSGPGGGGSNSGPGSDSSGPGSGGSGSGSSGSGSSGSGSGSDGSGSSGSGSGTSGSGSGSSGSGSGDGSSGSGDGTLDLD